MTFETIIGPKNTEHYEPSTFRFTNQKPPKITLYQIIWVKIQKNEKILSVLKNGPKINVFQFIWEVNGHKLSNLVTSYPIWSPMIKIMPRKVKNGQKRS